VFDGEERAAAPNGIGGGADEMRIVGAPFFSTPRRQNDVCSRFSCRVCAGNWAYNGLIYGRKEIDFFLVFVWAARWATDVPDHSNVALPL
jgi:hypothetical protein